MWISFNWIVDLLFLAFHRYPFDRISEFLKVVIKYIYMAFGVEWGSEICDWPGLHFTSLGPYLHVHVCVNMYMFLPVEPIFLTKVLMF
jgi:uncharacterized membrane protein